MKRSAGRIAAHGVLVRGIAALVAAGGVAAAIRPLAAHHSMAMYDRLRTMTLIGTVTEFQWTNPHVYVLVEGTIDVDDDPAIWRVETTSPSNLVRWGWSATALRPGDRVSIAVNPHQKSGVKSARLLKVTLLDNGQELRAEYLDLDLGAP
jgi:hypothetical protein